MNRDMLVDAEVSYLSFAAFACLCNGKLEDELMANILHVLFIINH